MAIQLFIRQLVYTNNREHNQNSVHYWPFMWKDYWIPFQHNWLFVWGTHLWPMDSPHKGPVTLKASPYHDVVISSQLNSNYNPKNSLNCSPYNEHNMQPTSMIQLQKITGEKKHVKRPVKQLHTHWRNEYTIISWTHSNEINTWLSYWIFRAIGAKGARKSGPWFNIKMSPYQYRKSHCGDKTILRPSYLHNGISYTGKTTSLYWIRAQEVRGFPICYVPYLLNNVTWVAGDKQLSKSIYIYM